jgi:hypothetical protein
MYVREKTIRRGEKAYSYYQLVEGERVEGRVRQRVLRHLGRCPSREHADMHARMMGLLCSALGCGQRGTIERRNHEGARALFCEDHIEAIGRGDTIKFYPLY